VPVTATLRKYVLGPIARTLLRIILRTWSLDGFEVGSVGAHKFGHLALEPLIGHLEARRRSVGDRKVLWTLGPRRGASNSALHALWHRELKIFPRHLLGLAISTHGPHLLPTTIYGARNVLDQDPWRPRLTAKDRDVGRRFLLDHGWDGVRPLIGIVVNEGLHYGKSWLSHETEIAPNLRVLTFRVHEFEPVISEMVRRGFTVVRLGAPPATPLAIAGSGVIDYATTGPRNAALDVILPGLMTTVISTQSGPDAVALMFGVPVAYVDVARLKYCFYDVSTVYWQPAVLQASGGERLGLRDLLAPEYYELKTPEDFASRGISVHRASPADRISAALEGIEFGSGAIKLDDRDREMQEVVRGEFARAKERGVLGERGAATGTLSPDFLRKNGDWFLRDL
jgi:putative glycosyltransferase (TIGR04372 family)